MPPEYVAASRSAASVRSTISSTSATRAARSRARYVEQPREPRHVLPGGQRPFDRQLLRDVAELLPYPSRRCGRRARRSTSTALDGVQGVEDAQRGGLAGAVRTEQAETLAGLHLQIQVVDGREVAVPVGEIAAVDRRLMCHAVSLLQHSGHLGQHLPARRPAFDLVGVEFVEHRGQRCPTCRPRLVGDALRRLGQLQAADPSVIGVDGPNQQTIGRQLGHQRGCGIGHQPQLCCRLPDRDSRLTATSRSNSAWDCVRPAVSNPRPVDRRSCRRNRPTTSNSSLMSSVRVSTSSRIPLLQRHLSTGHERRTRRRAAQIDRPMRRRRVRNNRQPPRG